MSLKSFLVSTLLAATAVATEYSWGGGGESSWSSDEYAGWGAVASCPAGCQPIATKSAPPPAATGGGELIVQVVSVADANGSLKYFPNKVSAPVGSIVQFQFHPKNHTITESSFAEPCKPLASNLTTPTRPGLKSGFVPVTGKEEFTPVFNVLINDTKPIWIYCGQTNHCQKGMAMVINQNDSSPNTIDAYIANAAKLPLVDVPTPPATSSVETVSSETYTFGGGGFGSGYASSVYSSYSSYSSYTSSVVESVAETTAESSTVASAPPVETVAPPSTSTAAVQPATFTGAAAPGYRVPESVVGVVLGALLALW
ncbi:uncharacterized protein Z518_01960 [Rhinocladiella mackenziei CBS 650.93]|uniref:Extracellular serine-rich protein n=1 Tax=Rhinocladiella mackenziei CBS 650.93 TaxID=1442369 RepID=A0A0D2FYB8_9EURO|nr:uncharacterized protein Z518_01960 [Rhinocladiella mackenziei CBS 650.93]KIX07307.1 hypothetical protein Z518_01960 [Rhinocladiella mackenziei CBS 650.93]